jgi:PKD repeat protein
MWVGSDHTIEPTNSVPISNPSYFPISVAQFRNFPGHYYQYNSSPTPTVGNEAFLVSEPSLSVNLYDDQASVPNGQSRYIGTKFNFEIVSNLNAINAQRSAPGFTNLLVRDQTGITYSSLSTLNTPTGQPLQNLILSIPFFWSTPGVLGNYWNTAERDGSNNFIYPNGNYAIWAESNVNQMNLVSTNVNVNLIPETLDVSAPPSVTRSNQFTVNITGRPNTTYVLSIFNNPCHVMSGDTCDQPPIIMPGQKNVVFDPTGNLEIHSNTTGAIEFYPVPCLPGTTIYQTVPKQPVFANPNGQGLRYYANVTTDENGQISVGFSTSTDTAPIPYIIHVQGMGLDGDTKFKETTVTVNMGMVTVDAASTAILGDNITISGTNTDSSTTYLYITGPCQPQCGANLTSPSVPLTPGTFTTVVINNSNHQWNYNPQQKGWVTGSLAIQPGEYTIYATSKPVNACDPKTCVAWDSTIITLLQPTINATINPEVLIRDCCSDQCVIIHGTTTGNPSHNVSMWIFGEQKVGNVHYVHSYITDCCGEFTINLCDPKYGLNLKTLPVGKYYVVLQHPMYNHVFDVLLEGDFQYDFNYRSPQHPVDPPYTIIGEQNKLYVIGSDPIRWSKLFPIEGADAKRELVALHALQAALDSPNIDDIYITLNFTIKDANAPTAAFTGTPTSGASPLTVSFTDQSLGNPTSWSWDFGDGTIVSTSQNPQHTYINEGDYTVKLTASKVVNGLTVSDSITKEHYIHVGPLSLQANFVADQTVGLKPFTVHFTDLTTGSPTQWNWNFGDGGFAIDQNPTHTYTEAGTYTVTLTDRNAEQTSTLAKTNYIVVTASPTPPPVDPSKIVLNPGWNFVSTPKTLASGYNTGTIFSEVNMGGRSAWIWDGSASPPQWVPVISTTPIQPLWGIWIYSVSNTVVNLHFDTTNPLYIPPPRSLPAGWSSIGFTGSTQQTARNTYLSVQPNWTTSMGFNSLTQTYNPTIFNGDPTESTILSPTNGYWLYMRSPGNLAAIGA